MTRHHPREVFQGGGAQILAGERSQGGFRVLLFHESDFSPLFCLELQLLLQCSFCKQEVRENKAKNLLSSFFDSTQLRQAGPAGLLCRSTTVARIVPLLENKSLARKVFFRLGGQDLAENLIAGTVAAEKRWCPTRTAQLQTLTEGPPAGREAPAPCPSSCSRQICTCRIYSATKTPFCNMLHQ